MLSKEDILQRISWELKLRRDDQELYQWTKMRSDATLNTLKKVLEEEHSFFALPAPSFLNQWEGFEIKVKMVLAQVAREDAEKAETPVVVELYDRDFKVMNVTDGWLVSDIDENALDGQPKVKARHLFVPHPDLSYNWETWGDTFFDGDGKPLITYEVHQVRWANIQTGERLHPDDIHKHLEVAA